MHGKGIILGFFISVLMWIVIAGVMAFSFPFCKYYFQKWDTYVESKLEDK
jgi:hypothetical protein